MEVSVSGASVEGQPLNITCFVYVTNDFELLEFEFLYENELVLDGTRTRTSVTVQGNYVIGSLSFDPALQSDSGDYECSVSVNITNYGSVLSNSTTINVEVKGQ